MKGHFTMSKKEIDQIGIFERLKNKQIKQKKAAQLLGLSTRQVRRKLKEYRSQGAVSLIHKNRGRVGNKQIDQEEIDRAIRIVRNKYPDFGPTFAHEKLTELHGIKFSIERLRQAMTAEGIWISKQRKKPRIHQMRERRSCEGELVQIDGSPHDWFEGRRNIGECSLLNYVDDATSKILHLEFAESESTQSYFRATKHYLEKHGKPLAFYSDRHGVFRVNTTKGNSAETADSNGLTQFGRAMQELRIEPIFANTPQAKGRVERSNKTLQDRLIKEMRLLGISSIKETNKYAEKFRKEYNRRFAVEPKNKANAHRPLLTTDNLDEIFTKQYRRVLTKNLTCQYKNKQYQIQTDRPTYAMTHAPVSIKEDMQGRISIEYKGKKLKYKIFKQQLKSEIIDTKRLNVKVDNIKKSIKPSSKSTWKPATNHPWRTANI